MQTASRWQRIEFKDAIVCQRDDFRIKNSRSIRIEAGSPGEADGLELATNPPFLIAKLNFDGASGEIRTPSGS